MNIQQAKEEIKNTVRAYQQRDGEGNYLIPEYRQRPILLMGPPGIGKTRIMEQICDELDIGLVACSLTHHTRQTALGLPAIVDREYADGHFKVTEYTLSDIIAQIYSHMKETGHHRGILFLDEINCISETLVPAMLQLLQQKTFGGQRIPDGWILVGAGNPPAYNRSARAFDIVTLDRVRLIEVEADLDAWRHYAEDAGVHGAVMSFLRLKPKCFFRINRDVDGIRYVTPRGWEDLSSLIKAYEACGTAVDENVVSEFIRDRDVAEDMAVYLDLYNRYRDDYHVEGILDGEPPQLAYQRLLEAGFDERVSVVRLILDALKVRAAVSGFADGTGAPASPDFQANPTPLESSLKNAFSFIEETMGVGNEMLIFVTGLTDSTDLLMHMMEHPSEEYIRFSDDLVGDTRRAKILSAMRE